MQRRSQFIALESSQINWCYEIDVYLALEIWNLPKMVSFTALALRFPVIKWKNVTVILRVLT
jgi:hypothetical protein